MISRAQTQFIRSLEQKRNRDDSGCFIAEGDKLVREALDMRSVNWFHVQTIYGTISWLDSNESLISKSHAEVIPVSESDLGRISLLKTPNQSLAVIKRDEVAAKKPDFEKDLIIALSQVQDPGNVGTIIRLADWFGIAAIIGSEDSADFYSPKVVQSSMGSIFRMRLYTEDIAEYIERLPLGYPVYGTHLKGENIYQAEIKNFGLILLGNESKGLSADLSRLTTKNLCIPNFASGSLKPESLNVSIAAAIVCSEFRRRGKG